MSSSESSYTWDEWYNRNKQNGKKSGLLDKHQEAYIMKQQRDELLEALKDAAQTIKWHCCFGEYRGISDGPILGPTAAVEKALAAIKKDGGDA